MTTTEPGALSAKERDDKIVAALDEISDALADLAALLPEGVSRREVRQAKEAVTSASNKIHRSHPGR
jgi:hypothetical protein